jgi:hypothetical protein
MSISAYSLNNLLRRGSLANKENCVANSLDTEVERPFFTTRSTEEASKRAPTSDDVEIGTVEVRLGN